MDADPAAFPPPSDAPPEAHASGEPENRAPRLAGTVLRVVKAVAIFLVVSWHLFFFAVRNPLDLWKKDIRAWLEKRQGWTAWGERAFDLADQATFRFANLTGCEQRWIMFSPPMARRASFLGTRFEFRDGSRVTVASLNEPTPDQFFRVGGWQTRKYEECLMEVPSPGDEEFPLWQAFARHKAREWRARHLTDPREMVRVVLVNRHIRFPAWHEPPGHYLAPEETDLATFDPEGRPLP